MKPTILKLWGVAVGMVCLAPLVSRAVLPAPFNVVYGNLYDGGVLISSGNTNYVVEARRTESGPAVARYHVGLSPAAGRFSYYLDLRLEELAPQTGTNTALAGDTLCLVLLNKSGVLIQTNYLISGRGENTRIDLGTMDTDGNGLPDTWEQRYFGQKGQDPNADPDKDDLSNLREYQEGLNPLVKDARHPADLSPKDNRLTMAELVAYAKAATNQLAWPVNPNPIPAAYLAKAEQLWKGGEYYSLDTNSAGGAPAWWTNTASSSASTNATSLRTDLVGTAVRSLPSKYTPGLPFTMTNLVTPAANITVYALEDQVPLGWVVTNISHNGVFDSVNAKVKWGPFYDATARQLTGSVVPAAAAVGLGCFSGTACLDGVLISLTGTDSLKSKINHAPVVQDDTFERPRNLPLILSTEDLLANDADVDGDVLFVRSVENTSQKGSTVLLEGGQVKYFPPQGMNDTDTFAYTVSDGEKIGVGMVTVTVSAGAEAAKLPLFTMGINLPFPGPSRIQFQGFANWDYEIQASTNLASPDWQTLGHGVTRPDGILEFEDPAAAYIPIRFYRAVAQ